MPQEIATLAGGCFWCLEAVFDRLQGVESVESGYMGGHKENPTYEEVCEGETGHAEVVRVAFDPQKLPYADLLEVFFAIHDPTTRNRQGNDAGPQYRSAIFFHSPEQEKAARAMVEALGRDKVFRKPIVTEIVPAATYYPAEAGHQEYYDRMAGRNPYCAWVIEPKLADFRREFAARLKKE